MRGEALFEFLLARWEDTEPEDRPRVFRELCAEASAAYPGDDVEAAKFMGQFISQAVQIVPDMDIAEKRTLLALARKAIEESEIAVPDDIDNIPDEDDGRPLTERELRALRKQAKKDREMTLDEFNGRYAVVKEGGAALVFEDCYDDGLERRFYDRIKPSSLQLLWASRTVCTRVDNDGKRHMQPVAKWWLGHCDRRTFLGGVCFQPGTQANRDDPFPEARPGFLNLWRGFNVGPRPGSWAKLQDHVRNVVCRGDEILFRYLMGWMARAVQAPNESGEVAVVLRGDTRVGKGILGHALRHLFGQHGMHVSASKHLVGNFNVHLRDCILLFADEAFFAGDKANISTLKAQITERVLTIEAKYLNAVQCPNMLHVIMASNEEWVVPAMIGEERFFVLDVLPTRKGDRAYFSEIMTELKSGGYEAMLHDLLHYDLTGFDVRQVPRTGALDDQKHYSLGTTLAWVREVIERGHVFESRLGLDDELHKWFERVSIRLLYQSYVAFAHQRGERHPLHQGGLEQFLDQRMEWDQQQPRAVVIVGEKLRGNKEPVLVERPRQRCYRLGTLAEARAAFEKATGLPIASAEGEPDDPEDVAAGSV